MRKEFMTFLDQNKVFLGADKSTVYRLIGSHGQQDCLLHFAMAMEDYDRVISQSITQNNFQNALNILNRHCKGTKDQAELFYKYAPMLMQYLPEKTV
jgi:vacuolar protein sorting-associated protein 18